MQEILDIIGHLSHEAAQIEAHGGDLTAQEAARVKALSAAVSLLGQAIGALDAKGSSPLITYKIVRDRDGRLKRGARVACNFWNRFIVPKCSTVVRVGFYTKGDGAIAYSYEPFKRNGVVYGVVDFNGEWLKTCTDEKIAGTIVHEIGHTLGIGFGRWNELFVKSTGKFKKEAIAQLGTLKSMRVETHEGLSTRHMHWDEEKFGSELMTGIDDEDEYVLPVTIDVMKLFGHQVKASLAGKRSLKTLLTRAARTVFARQGDAKLIDLDHFQPTKVWERLPHRAPPSR